MSHERSSIEAKPKTDFFLRTTNGASWTPDVWRCWDCTTWRAGGLAVGGWRLSRVRPDLECLGETRRSGAVLAPLGIRTKPEQPEEPDLPTGGCQCLPACLLLAGGALANGSWPRLRLLLLRHPSLIPGHTRPYLEMVARRVWWRRTREEEGNGDLHARGPRVTLLILERARAPVAGPIPMGCTTRVCLFLPRTKSAVCVIVGLTVPSRTMLLSSPCT